MLPALVAVRRALRGPAAVGTPPIEVNFEVARGRGEDRLYVTDSGPGGRDDYEVTLTIVHWTPGVSGLYTTAAFAPRS